MQVAELEWLFIAKTGHFRCKVCKSYCFMMTNGNLMAAEYEFALLVENGVKDTPEVHPNLPDDFDLLDLPEGECPGCSNSDEWTSR